MSSRVVSTTVASGSGTGFGVAGAAGAVGLGGGGPRREGRPVSGGDRRNSRSRGGSDRSGRRSRGGGNRRSSRSRRSGRGRSRDGCRSPDNGCFRRSADHHPAADDLVVLAFLEGAQHLLVLLLHQLLDDLFEVVDLRDVGVGGLLGTENRPPLVEEGDDVGTSAPAILGLDVIHLALVTKIVIEATDHPSPSEKMKN
ncbi:hypothetical protein DSOUD_0655 [Desulfuromonas soudanensis]|uniref:Uncharacterized protein n=1 Tax=Desulfuromonas soudanensis TaxID=1603606 RepID=A0A0M3QF46_9BACT|nr:hypothetical protein DSOUD_0655 [Desulfuromonas soudanensis]